MSADLGPDPADLRHEVIVEEMSSINTLLRELVAETRALRIALEHQVALLIAEIRERR
jgi:hypothetical protein